MEQEVLDRIRRIETRVTRIGNHLGADVGGGKPVWNPRLQRVDLPTAHCSIAECIAAVPEGFRGRNVDIYVNGEPLTTISI